MILILILIFLTWKVFNYIIHFEVVSTLGLITFTNFIYNQFHHFKVFISFYLKFDIPFLLFNINT